MSMSVLLLLILAMFFLIIPSRKICGKKRSIRALYQMTSTVPGRQAFLSFLRLEVSGMRQKFRQLGGLFFGELPATLT